MCINTNCNVNNIVVVFVAVVKLSDLTDTLFKTDGMMMMMMMS